MSGEMCSGVVYNGRRGVLAVVYEVMWALEGRELRYVSSVTWLVEGGEAHYGHP